MFAAAATGSAAASASRVENEAIVAADRTTRLRVVPLQHLREPQSAAEFEGKDQGGKRKKGIRKWLTLNYYYSMARSAVWAFALLAGCCLVSAAPMDDCTLLWFDQTIDHFSWSATPTGEFTYQQRYFICSNSTWNKETGAIFFYTG